MFDSELNQHDAAGTVSELPDIVDAVSNEPIVIGAVSNRRAVTDSWLDQPAVIDAESHQHVDCRKKSSITRKSLP